MNIYVETNFVLELTFEQEQQASCEQIDISENPQRVKETGFQPATADLETQPFPQRHQYLREF